MRVPVVINAIEHLRVAIGYAREGVCRRRPLRLRTPPPARPRQRKRAATPRSLGIDGELIVDQCDARRRPGGALGLVALGP
jgi:hypothetical protein